MINQRTIRVLCVDDHAFLVEGLKASFSQHTDLEVVGRLSTADTLPQEVRRLRPDIVLMDIEMPGADPFEAADVVKRESPSSRVVFLSAYVRDHYLSAAIKAGAWGYFAKADEVKEILDGIRRVARGEFTLGPKVAERCRPAVGARKDAEPGESAPARSKVETLTDRELEVLRLIGKGLSRADIAKSLHRSPKTIDGHREHIMEKLDIHSGAELVRFAIREGLVEA